MPTAGWLNTHQRKRHSGILTWKEHSKASLPFRHVVLSLLKHTPSSAKYVIYNEEKKAMSTAATAQSKHYSLADFRENVSECINRVKETQQPLMITVNDQVEVVVLDMKSYGQIIETIEYLETVDGIRRGLESMREGKGVPAEEVLAELRQKLNIPDKQ